MSSPSNGMLRVACHPEENHYGTRYFAHTKKGECTTASETAEHLIAKEIIARAVTDAGWTAITKCRNEMLSESEAWIEDVMAIQGNKRIALEIQWSRQSDEETAARQSRYRRSPVKGQEHMVLQVTPFPQKPRDPGV